MREFVVIPLGEILVKEYDRQKIEDAFKKFSCQRETDLENFLVHKAILYENANFGKTYLCIDRKALEKGNFIVLAYFTIAQKSLDVSSLSKNRKRKLLGDHPGRDGLNSVSTYLIGQLGRSDDCTAEELSGQQILNECYYQISRAAKIVGGSVIVLECREHMYEKFYKGQNFIKLYDELNEEGLYTLYKKINFTEYWKK